jgi:pimeloyl-ACP methyl ester carboxylesterase
VTFRCALVALVCICAGCGGGGASSAKPQKVAGEPGYRLRVDGHRMYYECAGNGSPTIVLEAGLGGDHRSWAAVAPALARTTKTCSYDRAGLGFSSAGALRRTGRDQVEDLHTLLGEAHIAPPYVLVAHSYGGILAHEFASAHPSDVAGLVLVDASHPRQAQRFLAALAAPRPGESPIRGQLRAFLRSNPPNEEQIDMKASFAQAASAGRLGGIPLVVVTAGRENDPRLGLGLKRLLDRTWLSLQDDLAGLSSNSIHVIADLRHHDVISVAGQPELVVKAARAVVVATRTHRHLPACRAVFRRDAATCVSG